MIPIICVIIIISFYDLRKMIKNKQQTDIICYAVIAAGSILYGYYYYSHMYTASLVDVFLRMLQVE